MIEADIEKYLARRVKALGGEVRKVAWLGRRHAPDRLVMLRGTHFFVELKRPGEKPRAGQRREHERMRAAGMRVEVAESCTEIDLILAIYGHA